MRQILNANLMHDYLRIIDPSGKRPIRTGYRLGDNKADFKQHIVPTSAGVVDHFNSLKPEGNMWICPAPRVTNHTAANKGGAAFSRVAWADFDIAGKYNTSGDPLRVPIELWEYVWVVQSGTRNNKHVYLIYDRPIGNIPRITVINWMLRKVLHADPKHSDESLLRLPGTFNGKNGAQVVPEMSPDWVRPISPRHAIDVLAGLLGMSIDDVRVVADRLAAGGRTRGDAGGLTVVDITKELMRKLKDVKFRTNVRAGNMPCRGNKSDARSGHWREFFNAGWNINETYSAMLKFESDACFGDWENDLVRLWGKFEAERAA